MRRVEMGSTKTARARTPFAIVLASLFTLGAFALAPPASAQGRDAPTPMPAGHPSVEDDGTPPENPHGSNNPHAGGGGGGTSGGAGTMFDAQPDVVDDDARTGIGTISVEIVDPAGKPLAHTPVVLGILHNSVAKGEKREQVFRDSDADGKVVFDKLENASGIAYRVSVAKDGATFAVPAFSLPRDHGIRVVLHIYPAVHKVIPLDQLGKVSPETTRDQALIVVEAILFTELKDDRIQVQQLFRLVNAGANAWVPEGLVTALPTGFSALVNGAQEPGDTGIEAEATGPRWRGTFPPGKHEVTYRWQMSWTNDPEVTFDVPMPPNVVSMRVMSAASPGMKLSVDGFPPGEPQTDAQGQRMLVTEKQLRRGDPLITSVRISMKDLPVIGPERWIAAGVASLALVFGFAFAFANRRPDTPGEDAKTRRGLLLADLEELERAHVAGDIGPKTYERTRRQLIDGIARTLVKAELKTATPSIS